MPYIQSVTYQRFPCVCVYLLTKYDFTANALPSTVRMVAVSLDGSRVVFVSKKFLNSCSSHTITNDVMITVSVSLHVRRHIHVHQR